MNKDMKKAVLAGFAMLCMATSVVHAQHDPHKANQFASMEMKQWSFSEESYYKSKVRKSRKILGIKFSWDEPGLGYHDRGEWIPATGLYIGVIFNPYALEAGHWDAVYSPDGYVNQKWRMYSPMRASAAGESVLYKNESNNEEDYWGKIRKLDVVTMADRLGVLEGLTGASTVTGTVRQESMDVVNENIDSIADEKVREAIMNEYYALQEQHSVINGAYMDNARKLEAMEANNQAYKELAKQVKTEIFKQTVLKNIGKGFGGELLQYNKSLTGEKPNKVEQIAASVLQLIENLNLEKL